MLFSESFFSFELRGHIYPHKPGAPNAFRIVSIINQAQRAKNKPTIAANITLLPQLASFGLPAEAIRAIPPTIKQRVARGATIYFIRKSIILGIIPSKSEKVQEGCPWPPQVTNGPMAKAFMGIIDINKIDIKNIFFIIVII